MLGSPRSTGLSFVGRPGENSEKDGRAMANYSLEERYLRQLLDHVSDAVVATDTYGRVTFANPVAQNLYGIAEEDAVGRGLLELLDMFDAGGNTDVDEITGVVAREGRWHGELIQRALDGRELVVEASVSMLADDDGAVLGSVSIIREISGRKEAERQISYQATHDGLTGLLNRTAFMRQLQESLTSGRQPTLIFLDLNGFKSINDLHGHDRGDEILRVIGSRLAGGLRPGDSRRSLRRRRVRGPGARAHGRGRSGGLPPADHVPLHRPHQVPG